MPISLKPPPPIASALRGSVTYARRAREDLRAGLGDARALRLEPPQPHEQFRRFMYGFTMPLTLLRIAWSNVAVRRSMVRRLLPPLALVSFVAIAGVASIVSSVVTARHDPIALAVDADDDEKEEGAHVDVEPIANAVKEAQATGRSPMDTAAAAIAAAHVDADVPRKRTKPARPTGFAAALCAIGGFLTSKVAKLIAALSVIEWILVWIGREHHDQIAFETATLTGVPGEELAAPPRLRLDVGWVVMKGWRAARLLIFFSLIAPVAWVVGMIPHVGSVLGVAAQAAWAVYWTCVFAIANTFLVWEDDPSEAAAPWFMRALDRAGRIPLVGAPVRIYGRVLRVATRRVWPACMAFESTTWESGGLALARMIASMPVLYIVTRPAFTPAATHALLARVGRPPDETQGLVQETQGLVQETQGLVQETQGLVQETPDHERGRAR